MRVLLLLVTAIGLTACHGAPSVKGSIVPPGHTLGPIVPIIHTPPGREWQDTGLPQTMLIQRDRFSSEPFTHVLIDRKRHSAPTRIAD